MRAKTKLLICTVIACGLAATVDAQDRQYPTRPVRFIAPFAPGGGSDFTARLFAQKLNERLGQSVIVDNRPGAGGAIGTEMAVTSTPDGYTLLVIAGSYAVNAATHKPAFDPVGAITPIIQFTNEPSIFFVHPAVPAKTLQELLDLAKRQPYKLAFGSSGMGGMAHLSMESFFDIAGIKLTHVPYKGTGPAVTDLIAGNVQFMSAGAIIVMPYIKVGRVRALAVTSLTRIPAAPDIPTVAESGVPGYEKVVWHGLVGPRGVPRNIVNRINAELNHAMQSKEIEERFYPGGILPAGGTAEHFLALIKSDIALWQGVVARLGIQLH